MKGSSKKIVLAIFGLLVIAACKTQLPAPQQKYPVDKFQSREARIGGETFRYRVYVPQELSEKSAPAVLLYLHGAGNRGTDNDSQLNGLAKQIEAKKDKINFIIVIPQCLPDGFWDEQMLARADKAMNDTVEEFKADGHRLYLAGFSLGGYGVWSMAATHPGKFAAIVPMSGRVLPRPNEIKHVSKDIAQMSETADPYRAFAEKIGNTPTWIFHGADDNVVAPENSRRMFAAMKAAGNQQLTFEETPGKGHEPLAFAAPGFFEWLTAQSLDR